MAGRSVVYCLPNENRRFSQREAEALELNLTQKQVQTLSPQMMQSMEILQMGSQELLEYIEEAVQENPVLEPEETYDKQDASSAASWSGWSPPTRRTATTTSRTPRRRTAPLTTSAPYRTTTRTSTIMSSPSSGYWSWSQR